MSWDISIGNPPCPTCGHAPPLDGDTYSINVTRNVSEIVDRCLIAAGAPASKAPADRSHARDYTWGRLNGWACLDAVPVLEKALAEARRPDRIAEFSALEPANGWGNLDSVCTAFQRLLYQCRDNPNAVISCYG